MITAEPELPVRQPGRALTELIERESKRRHRRRALWSLARISITRSFVRRSDGIVITRNIDPRQTVASVLKTPVLFTVAADLRKMDVVAAVDEADIGEVAIGQHVTFTVDAYPGRVFEGVVTEVRNLPVIVQDVVTDGTVVQVNNADLALKPGMTASIRIRTASTTRATSVPNGAFHFAPPGAKSADIPGVWLLQGDALRRVTVRPGISDGELTEIAAGPIAPGTNVLVDLTGSHLKRCGHDYRAH